MEMTEKARQLIKDQQDHINELHAFVDRLIKENTELKEKYQMLCDKIEPDILSILLEEE